ncbi:MAG: FAD-binding oxidoreductase [Actinobacteria bacterium]|nr:MAG: FAD-binding oxidoreductase [Actinomycetota bacterium]
MAAKPDLRFQTPPVGSIEVDREALRTQLEADLEGEVRFRPGDRALYATGGSNYRLIPIGVVIPRSVDDVLATLAACRGHGAPVLSRGGGTSLAGQIANVAVVVDFSKYLNRIVDIDPRRKLARVQPGLILDHLRNEAEARYGLTYGPDPSTHDHDQVEELDVVTYRGDRFTVRETPEPELDRIISAGGAQGEIYRKLRDLRDRVGDLVRERYPNIPRRVSGYNLDRLLPEHGFDVAAALTGTESTCITVLEATVRLIESPPCRSLLVLGFADPGLAGDHVPMVMAHKPLGLEGVDDVLLEDMTLVHLHDEHLSMMPRGHDFLLIEFGGETKEEADAKANALVADLRKDGKHLLGWTLYDDKEAEAHVWEVREAGLGATAFIPGKDGYESALYGHYGQGCIHARWNFDLKTKDGIATFRRFLDDAADLVLSMGGSLSGEHGDGQSRAELLPKMFGDELVEAFREFKSIWDPDWKMNPGKVVDPYRITDNLRLGTGYAPPRVDTHFAFADDGGSFAHATVRCVGIGKCRRTEGGVMCPSYMVTKEEKHTTRGRAHLLFEMLEGDPVEGVWSNEEVFEALDLCLSCKGCTNDCPVHVDMPTLKSEFLAHRYKGRLRPRHAYAFGLIDQAARVAAHAPGVVNALTQSPGLARVAKAVAGMAPEREFPAFAPQTLQAWFATRGSAGNPTGKTVLLWPDTFTNHFHTEVGVAAVEALDRAGYNVVVPEGHLCCGRPLYDYGFLGLARLYLERTIDRFRDEIRAGIPIVGIEPSCTAVFKDELGKMLPDDEDGKRLAKQIFHFGEFLEREGYEPPTLPRKVLLHGHCHHKATGGMGSEQTLLEQMGAEVEAPDSGCCGLAGSWGYETGHYDVSMACGERVLLPEARRASTGTLLVADGFSCRTQIEHGARRKPLHLAQVVALAQSGEIPARPANGSAGVKVLLGALLAGGAIYAAKRAWPT